MLINKPRKIFIVEDDPLQADLLKDRLLRDANHDIHVFYTGESCLRALTQHPEVIIIDYHLDGNDQKASNGMEIITTIKATYPDIHVIMLSSQERYGVALQSIQKGAEQYVVKDKDAFEKITTLVNELK